MPSSDSPHHAREAREVLRDLESREAGLTESEARSRLERVGPNRLPEVRRTHPVWRFLGHFHNTLIYVLLAAAVVTGLLDHWIDSAIILAVVLVNATIGFLQEGKAEKALEAVRGMLSVHAWVRRDGERRRVPAEVLVPGDIVLLGAGDRVPADLRLLEVRDLRVIEASLTGESDALEKSADPVVQDAPLGDRFCMAYSGTIVAAGQAIGVVTATAAATELGRINAMLAGVEHLATPLVRQVTRFGRSLTLVILGLSALTFAAGTLIAGRSPREIFFAVVGIAVAAIPEGLPAIMTITLAIGVQRMARRHAIVRRLPAVETLGSVTVICSDKTGTLTRSEMTVTRIVLADETIEVGGTGYEPAGELRAPGGEAADLAARPHLRRLLLAGVASNDARLVETATGWAVEGAPTEGAFLALGAKAGLQAREVHAEWPRRAEIPFSSERKFMATMHQPPGAESAGRAVVFVKGAPERVLERCDGQAVGPAPARGEAGPGASGPEAPAPRAALDREWWEARSEALASEGFRVLAVAETWVDDERDGGAPPVLEESRIGGGLTLLGLVGLLDPPRPEAVDAIRECRQAGIRVKMITGDHASTARAVGRRLGLGDGGEVVSGSRIEASTDEELVRLAKESDLFARVSPEHKLRLVTALQRGGQVTAMTGDGVNDAPALKQADIGIAMGIKGTEAAKEASEMVLADDNFASIVNAVEEGRTVYDNLKKALLFILPTNGGEALIVIAAILFGLVLPVTPAQILWVNMVTAVTLALALAFEPMEPDAMRRPPRSPREPLVAASLLLRIAFVSVLMMAGSLGLFLAHHRGEDSIALARTVAVNALVFAEIAYLWNSRLVKAPALTRAGLAATAQVWLAAGAVLGLQLLFTYLPLFQSLFGTAPIGLREWAWVGLLGLAIFLAVEAEKLARRRRDRRRAGRTE